MADETNNPGQPSPDELAEQALRAAQEAIAGLTGDLNAAATPTTSGMAPAGGPTPTAQSAPLPPSATAFVPPSFGDAKPAPAEQRAIDLLSDVNLNVKIELGRTRMLVEDVLRLAEGCVVELDKLAGDPVDIYVNERHVARGEVLVLNDNFCVRVSEILQEVGEPRAALAKPA